MEGAITSYLTCEVTEAERLSNFFKHFLFFKLVAQLVKNPPAKAEDQEMWVCSLGGEDSLEWGMATHTSILVWEIPWTEEPGRLWSMRLQRVGHD